jgi:hypothetical protein
MMVFFVAPYKPQTTTSIASQHHHQLPSTQTKESNTKFNTSD